MHKIQAVVIGKSLSTQRLGLVHDKGEDLQSQLRALRILRRLESGGMRRDHNGIVELEGTPPIVRVSYNPKWPKHVQQFHRTVKLFERLLGCEFTPKLLYVDLERLEIYTTNAGSVISPWEALFGATRRKPEVDAMLKTLETKYRIVLLGPDGNTTTIVPPRWLNRRPTADSIAQKKPAPLILAGLYDGGWTLLP